MKQKDFLTRYKQALVSQFKVENNVFKKKELEHYISKMQDNEMIVLSAHGFDGVEGHTMLIVKQDGKYHFYDPNAREPRFDFIRIETPKDIAYRVEKYGSDLEKYGLSDMKEYTFERMTMPKIKGYISESSAMLDGEELEKMADILKSDGSIKAIDQGKILKIVAAYFNTVYKPTKLVEPSGVCYALSVMLRELTVQTGSIDKAKNMLYLSMHRLEKAANELGIKDETMLSDEMLNHLGGNQLLLSMIPLFHSMQIVELQDTSIESEWMDKITHVKPTVDIQKFDSKFALPLSVMMHTPSVESKVLLSSSNPIHVYSVLTDSHPDRKIPDEELSDIYESVHSDTRFTDRPEWLLEKVKSQADCLMMASINLRNNKDFMLQAIKNNPIAVFYLPESLRKDKGFIREVMPYSPYVIRVMDSKFKRDKGLMLSLFKFYPKVLLEFPEPYLDDKILMSAVDAMRADKKLMLEAMARSHTAWEYLHPGLRNDVSFVLDIAEAQPSVIQKLKSWFSNKELMLALIERRHEAVVYLNIILKEDKDFMLKAIVKNPLILNYVEPKFLGNKQFILGAIQEVPQAYIFADRKLKSSNSFMLKAVQLNTKILEHVGDDWLNNRKFMIQATLLDENSLEYAPHFKDDTLFNIGLSTAKKIQYAKSSIAGMCRGKPKTRDVEVFEALSKEIDEGFVEITKAELDEISPNLEQKEDSWAKFDCKK